MRAAVLVILAACFTAVGLLAQQADTSAMSTDRPDFTDGTARVEPGHVQIEGGYTFTESRGPGAPRTHDFPQLLVRVGVMPAAELRLSQDFTVEQRDADHAAAKGFDDVAVGTKLGVVGQAGIRPSIGVELGASLPTGSGTMTSHRVLPGGALIAEWDGPGRWSAGTEVRIDREAGTGWRRAASLSVQYQLLGRLQCYGEWFVLRPPGARAESTAMHYLDGGAQLGLGRNIAVDAFAGAGLSQSSDRLFLGAGLAILR